MLPKGLMISAPSSGTGKTTVMLGLLRAISDLGLTVQPFKSGPDYIDPAFHHAAARRPSFNLDSWSMNQPLFAAISAQALGADIAIAEGSMGLFDGVASKGASGFGSSAETAIASSTGATKFHIALDRRGDFLPHPMSIRILSWLRQVKMRKGQDSVEQNET